MAKSSSVASLADVKAVRALLADAQPVARATQIGPKPGERLGNVGAGDWQGNGLADALGLPPECPVKPLGMSGNVMWFLDPRGQVQSMGPPYNRGQILGLFLGQDYYLQWAWPKLGKKGVDGFAAEEVGPTLIRACAAKGPWKAVDKLRGRGCWTGNGGDLIVHCGNEVLVGGRYEGPGEFDGYVYPAYAKLPRPWPAKEELPFNAARLLRIELRKWSWTRPEIDQHLLLGWLGAAFLGAALPWRPMIFITGDKGTGKSTLQSLIKGVLGDWLVTAADTTAAGIYQHVGLDSVAVAIDELESESDNKKVAAVLRLARLASSGAAMLRGGSDHNGMEFQARSAFLFSSINAPPLPPQDLSRMGLLRLQKLATGGAMPVIEPTTLGMLGRCILRQLIDQWPRFHETVSAFSAELGRAGMDGRGQAQFGTLLACADMLEHDGWDEARLRFAVEAEGDLVPWSKLLRPEVMHEFEDQSENWRSCLSHLMSVRVEAWRAGVRQTVGQVCLDWYCKWKGEKGGSGEDIDVVSANKTLAQAGLKLIATVPTGGRPDWHLFVPNQSPLVRELFKDSHWQGSIGAAVWSAALRQAPQGAIWHADQRRVNGVQFKGTMIRLEGLYGPEGAMREEVGDDE